jgi:release factor glutamine methyltransferase
MTRTAAAGSQSSIGDRRSSSGVRALLERGVELIGRSDAEFLLGELTGKPRHALYESDSVLTSDIEEHFCALAGRAAGGTPVEYLLNTAAFMDFRVHVDERVLIPRSETEELVTRAVARLKGSRNQGTEESRGYPLDPSNPRVLDSWCLDLGTGSGCIAIALARSLPKARIVATDISPAAIEVAAINITRHGLSDRIELLRSDLFAALAASEAILRAKRYCERSDTALFDLVVANPPYIPTSVLVTLSPSVRDHEPLSALDGGADGMSVIKRIIREAPAYMRPGALLALEIDPAVAIAVRRLLPDAVIEQDIQGLERFCFWSRVETTNEHR